MQSLDMGINPNSNKLTIKYENNWGNLIEHLMTVRNC